MNETQAAQLDQAAFQRVWNRVMPQDRPDCPFTLEPPTEAPQAAPAQTVMAPMVRQAEPPQQPPLCLGESSAPELPTLEALLTLTADSFRAYRALSLRAGRTGRRALLSTLAAAKNQQARRLSAAHFLISGRRFVPQTAAAPVPASLPLALRERFQAEQRAVQALLTAAQAAADPCLADLYQALAAECRTHAAQLRSWLEDA